MNCDYCNCSGHDEETVSCPKRVDDAERYSIRFRCPACSAPWDSHKKADWLCIENERLRDIIMKASTTFFNQGSDGAIAASMFAILAEMNYPKTS